MKKQENQGSGWHLKDQKNLRPEEIERLFATAKKYGRRIYLMVIVAYNGAFRVSELIHLKVKDWNFPTSKVFVIPLKKAGRRRIRSPNGEIRVIDRALPDPIEYPMPRNISSAVEKYVRENELPKDSFLFPGRSKSCNVVKLKCPGGHISKRMVQWIFDRLAVECHIKIPGRGIHCLKHARLTEVAAKTHDPYFVRDIGRHSSISISGHYVRFAERVDELGGKV